MVVMASKPRTDAMCDELLLSAESNSENSIFLGRQTGRVISSF
jgi:hypothetical protein